MEPPEYLYHYTTQRGLVGIIQSRSIWATSIHYMNDSMELQHAISLVKSECYRRTNDSKPAQPVWAEISKRIDTISSIYIYVFSLSEEGDQLSQWRGYCPNGGFSLAFLSTRLKNAAVSHNFSLVRCIYEYHEQQKVVSLLLDDCFSDEEGHSTAPDQLDKSMSQFLNRFLSMAPALKDRSFSEEKEWRLVSWPIPSTDKRVRVREGNSTLIPYYEMNLEDEAQTNDKGHLALPFNKVIVGPTPNPKLAMDPITNLFSSNGLEWQETSPSRIPYRDI